MDLLFRTRKISIVAIYRPPQGCKRQFISELERILDTVCDSSNEVIVLGDINLNLLYTNDPIVQDYTSMLFAKNLISLINKPTRFPNAANSSVNPSILDHLWTNHLDISACGIIDYDVSDHLPVFCTFKYPNNFSDNEKIKIESRPFSEANLLKLVTELDNTDWDLLLDYNDPENSIDIFSEKLNSLYVKCFPLKIKYISQKRLKNKWITQEVKLLIN